MGAVIDREKVINRISKAIGHLKIIKHMVERDEDSSEVLIQLATVRSEINHIREIVLKDYLANCIVEASEQSNQETIEQLNNAIDML